jgi:very-short-patch-repair endonuclease
MNEPRDRARSLRKNLTDSERLLWAKLRNRRFAGFKFRRQVPLGSFIADFVCFERRLILELDGGQHAQQQEYDAARTRWMEGAWVSSRSILESRTLAGRRCGRGIDLAAVT